MHISFMVYSYKWFPEETTQQNAADIFISWPGNVGSTALMVLCYALILVKLRKTRQAIAGRTNSTQQAKKKALEARLAIQFLMIALVYFSVWGMFRICPLLIGNSPREAYVIVALLVIANCTVNPVIYLGKRQDYKNKDFIPKLMLIV